MAQALQVVHNSRSDEQLLIPLGQASRMLGITKQTLRKHIKDGLIKAVKVGTRAFVPRAEMDRILNGQPIENQETAGVLVLSPKPANQNHAMGENNAEYVETKQNRQIISPNNGKDRIWDLLGRLEELKARQMDELEQDVIAGNPQAIAAKAALDAIAPGIPAGPERQREIGTHNETWAAWCKWR